MPMTPARQFRLKDETLAKIDELAKRWGGELRPLPRAVVITECVNREADRQTRTRTTRKGK